MRYFEDLKLGQVFGAPPYEITSEKIIEFAREYDPQSFHTEPQRAPESFFGQHVASGWQTASIAMRLLVTGEHQFAGGMIGLGVEEIRWKRPTLPGMRLTMKSEIVQLSRSGKFPKHGLVKLRHKISDEISGHHLAEMTTLQIVLLREAQQS
jgi:acyl dehydratase